MGAWAFVLLAYGVVWTILLLYHFVLKRRIRKVEAELSLLRSSRDDK